MVKPRGTFVGNKKFAVDPNWIKDQRKYREFKEQERFKKWSQNWITVSRLKKDRLWTDAAIKQFLGKPKKQGKYRVFSVEEVEKAERKRAFCDWLAPRLERKLIAYPHFKIKKIGAV